jgi:hypothetical protein
MISINSAHLRDRDTFNHFDTPTQEAVTRDKAKNFDTGSRRMGMMSNMPALHRHCRIVIFHCSDAFWRH